MSSSLLGPIAESAEAYHSRLEISRSQIVDFMRSPKLYHRRYVLRDPVYQKKPTAALDFGEFCHEAILIHKDATAGFRVIPDSVLSANGSKAGNKWKEWEAANQGVAHFKMHEVGPWLAMWESLSSCADARRLLLDNHEWSYEERSVVWSFNGIDLRCRIDRVIPGCIADLKTCRSGDINHILAEIEHRKLYIQAAWYSWGWKETSGELLPFVFVFVEKAPPYATVCVRLDSDWISDGMREIEDALIRLQRRSDADDWTDPGSEEVFTLSRQSWADRQLQIRGDIDNGDNA